MIDTTDPIELLRRRNPIPPGSLYEAAAEQAAGVLAKLRADDSARLARRSRGRRRLGLVAVAGVLVLLGVAGVATATGVMPWITTAQEFNSTPFVTAPAPETLPGSKVVFSAPGPESTTFELVTNDTVTIGGKVNHCTAVINVDSQGQAQGAGLRSCGASGAATDATLGGFGAGSFGWQAPSGTNYAVVIGATPPTSNAAVVALQDPNGATLATAKVRDGYFLIYTLATATLPSNGSVVFSDASGHVIGSQPIDLSPFRPCVGTAPQGPCG